MGYPLPGGAGYWLPTTCSPAPLLILSPKSLNHCYSLWEWQKEPWAPRTRRVILRYQIVLPPTPWHMTQHYDLWTSLSFGVYLCEVKNFGNGFWVDTGGYICCTCPHSDRETHYIISLAFPSLHFTCECFFFFLEWKGNFSIIYLLYYI